MEGLDQKLDRINGDISQLVDLYDFAEKLYPYENIREPTKVKYSNLTHLYNYSWMSTNREEMLLRWLHLVQDTTTSKELDSGVLLLLY